MAEATDDANANEWDYVIVGSGAGGATLAARLAEAGMRVFLLEAGGDPRTSGSARLPEDYDVPGFHAFACENEAMSWDFHVRHYADESRQARDPKYDAERHGVLYPRAAALGGCTAHNAMIFMRPHDADWNHIADITGDIGWRAPQMQRYFERVEACHHRPWWRLLRGLRRFGFNPTGHGWDGWLRSEHGLPIEALGDDQMVRVVAQTAKTFTHGLPSPLFGALRWLRGGAGDPNATPGWRRGSFEGVCYVPLSTANARRTGARERLLDAAARHPDRLHIETHALATEVLFDPTGAACGVAYLKGPRLYHAHPQVNRAPGEPRLVRARREVVLCGGAFNTPQLLMLSGIGPAAELRRHAIPLRVDLPGVGNNLQDRYEVAVTHCMQRPWKLLQGALFERGDPLWQRWNTAHAGMYAASGAALGIVHRSAAASTSSTAPAAATAGDPDLFCMALPARFE
ncbi:MAG: glucose-methanol-choline oxidoreductase, partial [Rhodoferax sp.]|nr:glucose-methanol-choline oxidoreductase [Rhodoferax sp.]